MAAIVMRSVGTPTHVGGGFSTVSSPLGKAAKKGNLLVAGVRGNVDKAALTIAGFTVAASVNQGSGTTACATLFKIAAGGETSIDAAIVGSTSVDVHAYEFAIPDVVNPLDRTITATSTGAAVTTLASGATGITTQNIELAFFACQLSVAVTSPAASGYAVIMSQNLITGYKLLSVTGTQSATPTWTGSAGACLTLATFRGGVGFRFRKADNTWSTPRKLLQRQAGGTWA